MDNLMDNMSEWDKRRYHAAPGEPALPPQLSQYTNKSTDEVMSELNKLPLFMNELDDDGGENTELEALKALAYEGEPWEIATNFKNQGNDCFRAKNYQDAITYYNRALDVGCEDNQINAALHLNLAACNLELKNYRRCINDCKECLKLDPVNIKALWRSAKAYFAVNRLDEAEAVLSYAKSVDAENASIKTLSDQVAQKRKKIEEARLRKEQEEKEKEQIVQTLAEAIRARNMCVVNTPRPADMLEDAHIRLEDPRDIESQLIFPAMIVYPSTDEFDFVAEVSELTTPLEIIELVTQRDPAFLEKHPDFTPKQLEAYMETESGGLIKVGKKVALNTALMSTNPRVPLFDNALRLYVVPKTAVKEWLSSWSKDRALKKRRDI